MFPAAATKEKKGIFQCHYMLETIKLSEYDEGFLHRVNEAESHHKVMSCLVSEKYALSRGGGRKRVPKTL